MQGFKAYFISPGLKKENFEGFKFLLQILLNRKYLFFLQHLWKLVVEDSHLMGQLNTLKDFFLLGRGELFLAFIDQVQNLLKTPPIATTENGKFQTPK